MAIVPALVSLRGFGVDGCDVVARFRSASSSAMMSTDERTFTCFGSGAFIDFSLCAKLISGSGVGGGGGGATTCGGAATDGGGMYCVDGGGSSTGASARIRVS